jgi:hypothetical protein
MSKVARWFLMVGLYALGFAIFLPLTVFVAAKLQLGKIVADVLVVIAAIMVFLGANFLVGLYQGYSKRKNGTQ